MAVANPHHKAVLDDMLLGLPGVTAGMMFGFPAYYVGGKLLACVYRDAIGLKVPEALAKTLLAEPHVVPFQPMGRPRMREWVQIERAVSEDYRRDLPIFEAALAYVATLSARC